MTLWTALAAAAPLVVGTPFEAELTTLDGETLQIPTSEHITVLELIRSPDW